jgi:hypothetical protein
MKDEADAMDSQSSDWVKQMQGADSQETRSLQEQTPASQQVFMEAQDEDNPDACKTSLESRGFDVQPMLDGVHDDPIASMRRRTTSREQEPLIDALFSKTSHPSTSELNDLLVKINAFEPRRSFKQLRKVFENRRNRRRERGHATHGADVLHNIQ